MVGLPHIMAYDGADEVCEENVGHMLDAKRSAKRVDERERGERGRAAERPNNLPNNRHRHIPLNGNTYIFSYRVVGFVPSVRHTQPQFRAYVCVCVL